MQNQRKKDENLIGTCVTKLNPWHVYPLPSSFKSPSIIENVNTATVSMMNVAEQSSEEWLIDSGAAINCGPNGHGVKNSTILDKKCVEITYLTSRRN